MDKATAIDCLLILETKIDKLQAENEKLKEALMGFIRTPKSGADMPEPWYSKLARKCLEEINAKEN